VRIGRPPAKRRNSEQKLSAARARVVRANAHWTELEQLDLVPRDHGVLVSASSDWAYRRHPGVVFERGSTNMVADHSPLYFVVDEATDELTFLERMPSTWSDQVARRERRRARANA
jgi:hypothetical protein